MGMFDEKRYLTGKSGVVTTGDTFRIHGARISGMVRKQGGAPGDQVKEAELTISKDGTSEPIKVYTTGAGIVGQIDRLDAGDQQAMRQTGGMPVRLGEIPASDASKNPTHILEPESGSAPVPDQTPGQF